MVMARLVHYQMKLEMKVGVQWHTAVLENSGKDI
jgi:hypothetical protein